MKEIILPLCMQPLVDVPIDLDWRIPVDPDDQQGGDVRQKLVPDTLIPALIMYINSHKDVLHKLVEGFHSENPQVSKRQLEMKIREIAIKEKGAGAAPKTAVWRVREEVMRTFSVPIPDMVDSKQQKLNFFFRTPTKNNTSATPPSPSTPSSSASSTLQPSLAPTALFSSPTCNNTTAPSSIPSSENGVTSPLPFPACSSSTSTTTPSSKGNILVMFQKQHKPQN